VEKKRNRAKKTWYQIRQLTMPFHFLANKKACERQKKYGGKRSERGDIRRHVKGGSQESERRGAAEGEAIPIAASN